MKQHTRQGVGDHSKHYLSTPVYNGVDLHDKLLLLFMTILHAGLSFW